MFVSPITTDVEKSITVEMIEFRDVWVYNKGYVFHFTHVVTVY